jgi:hypothetical protein
VGRHAIDGVTLLPDRSPARAGCTSTIQPPATVVVVVTVQLLDHGPPGGPARRTRRGRLEEQFWQIGIP